MKNRQLQEERIAANFITCKSANQQMLKARHPKFKNFLKSYHEIPEKRLEELLASGRVFFS